MFYAPGAEKQQYQVISLTIDPSDLYVATATNYPRPELLNFPELKEVVPVYSGKIDTLTTSLGAVVSPRTLPVFCP